MTCKIWNLAVLIIDKKCDKTNVRTKVAGQIRPLTLP